MKWWTAPDGKSVRQSAASPGPNWHGPYSTKAAAQYEQLQIALKGPGFNSSLLPGVNVPNVGINSIGDFFHRLTEKETWVRVGEVALGGILLYAGVHALSSGTAVSSASKSISKPVKKTSSSVAKIAIPEARLASRTVAKRAAPKTTAKVASHRAQVAKYGAKKPYKAPVARPPTTRVSHVYHHASPKKVRGK